MPDKSAQHPNPEETESDDGEVFDLSVEPVEQPIELFELTFPRPPQGTWRENFDIRVDVRFAHMDLQLDNATIRVATTAARLSTSCSGCTLLPHSLFGLSPLPTRSVVAVEEKQTSQVGASASAQAKAKVGGLQVFDASCRS
jgi:hypothetical protein